PLFKRSLRYLMRRMRPQDKVAVIAYSGEARVVVPSTPAKQADAIIAAIDSIESKGKTNVLKGLELAYQMAEEHFIDDGNNRLIMATDGYFNVVAPIPQLVKTKAAQGYALSIFFMGKNDEPRYLQNSRKLAGIGGGNFYKVSYENTRTALIREAKAVRNEEK
ncbi:MAG: VWA domain-containing protein, partial [Bacteroidota bacterium]